MESSCTAVTLNAVSDSAVPASPYRLLSSGPVRHTKNERNERWHLERGLPGFYNFTIVLIGYFHER